MYSRVETLERVVLGDFLVKATNQERDGLANTASTAEVLCVATLQECTTQTQSAQLIPL